MKSAKGSLNVALDRPDPSIRFYLFYGPDEAGSRAHALRLLKGIGDAERFIVMGQSIKSDPATLADEAGAMSLFGGKRAVWIEPAGDEITEGVSALLDGGASESAVIALAGPLRKTSSLLKLAESHPRALAHISYVPEGREVERVVIDLGSALGLRLSPDVAQRIAGAANNNQAIASQELEKLALFVGASGSNPKDLSHESIDAVGADSSEGDMLRLGDLALGGRMDELVEELTRLPRHGSEAIPALRALQRRLLMLAPLRAKIENGERVDGVMAAMGKSLFWKDKPLIQKLLSTWSAERIAEAASRVAELEKQLIFAGVPSDSALGETLVSFARVARPR
ncbi:DNA polymerase III subunit delta [Sphingomonas sp. LY29]|uniref:DNA polymerase III subunit delta n=1 Tax=Sphingomonas sp. LY29 TaxID=3095341 RepID=UPI002D77DDC5|nr:DNA polymerase III subunit delta [Sphingomonas sp. LY29]WRP24918.1 DNA polymerase III subunit delta [Sphingomonas sp. LY29]